MEATPIKNIFEAYAYYAQILLGPEILQYTNKTILGFFFFAITTIIFYHIIEEFLSFVLRESPYGEHLNKTKKAIAALVTLLAIFSVSFFKAMFTFGLILALLAMGFIVYIIFFGLLKHAPVIEKFSPWISLGIAAAFVSWIVYDRITANIAKVAPPSPEIALSIDWIETLQWVVIGILFLQALRDHFRIKEIGERVGKVSNLFRGFIERTAERTRTPLIEEITEEEKEIEHLAKTAEQEEKAIQQIEKETKEEEKILLKIKEYIERGETPPRELLRKALEEIQHLKRLSEQLKELSVVSERFDKKIEEKAKWILDELNKYGISQYTTQDITTILRKQLQEEEKINNLIQRLLRELNIEKEVLEEINELLYNMEKWLEKGEVNPEHLKKVRRQAIEALYDVRKLKTLEKYIKQLIDLYNKLINEIEEAAEVVLNNLLRK